MGLGPESTAQWRLGPTNCLDVSKFGVFGLHGLRGHYVGPGHSFYGGLLPPPKMPPEESKPLGTRPM